MRALVCGAGVGGLSAGIALRNRGFDVVVFEQADELRVTGAGLNLWPNAGRALYALGLRSQYDATAAHLDHYLTLASDGSTILRKSVQDWPKKFGAPASGIYRERLSALLADAVGHDNIRFGHRLARIESTASVVTCTFENGETYSGDFLIGADGIHSSTRRLLFGEFALRENQHHLHRWRGTVRLTDVEFDPHAETEVFGDGCFFGSMPLDDESGYWFASGPGLDDYESFSARFSSWTASHVPSTISATIEDSLMQTKLWDFTEAPERWTVGRVTLLGDAAHPMMPDMAQGASQTFVDAAVLGECFASGKPPEDALGEYESIRRPASYRVVDLSKRGMFTNMDGSGGVDPIAVRYERDVEQQHGLGPADSPCSCPG